MGEEPLTVAALARFHREILLPDMERLVDARINALELHQNSHFDEIYKRFERLEIEYHALVAGLKRVEERLDRVEDRLDGVEQRLDRVEQRLDKLALKSELLELKARVEGLQAQVQALEDRLSA